MLTKISPKIWKFTGTDKANIYFLDLDEKIIIDTGNRADRQPIIQFLGKVVDFKDVDKVIFTHLHYDHIGNFDLFPNAEFFASEEEIKDFEKRPRDTILSEDMAKKFNVKLKPLPSRIDCLDIIKTPGHTNGSICIWYEKERILFTGDTMFAKSLGRTDLPTSAPGKIKNSLIKLVDYNYKILASGHDY